MATFLLRPQHGERDIAIPVGKTTIGRGPFLGITDKRVSRSHALVELTDGKLSVLPIHSNPTFYKACMKEKFVVLKRNEAQELLSGDTISLLPNTLCFKVVCGGSMSYNGLNTEEVAGSAAENAHSVVFDYHEKSSTSTEVPTGSFLDEFIDNRLSPETVSASAKLAIKYNKDPVLEFPRFPQSQPTQGNKGKVLPSKPEIIPAPPLQKTRKLPSWLIQSTSSEAKSEANKGRNRRDKASAKTCKTEKTATPNKSGKTVKKSASALAKQGRWDSDEGFLAGDGDEGDQPLKQKGKGKSTTPLKRTSAKMPESDDDDDDITPVRHKKAKQLSSESDEESSTTQSAKKQDVTKPAEPVLGHESCGINEDAKPAASKKKSEMKTKWKDESTASNLPLCPYGSKCYRKNPIHFKEYSHPDKGSKGYEEDSDGSDDDKPECPYGTGCYRRNSQHKQDYKHTKAPERPKRGKSKHKSVLDNESDDDLPNTYDYNDSFLDDGDIDGSGSSYSAGSDDSDWRPKGGDDDGDDDDDDEDVNELLSEARGFLRSKMARPI